MKVKRLFCLLLICLVVVSCGTDEVQEEFDETPNQPKETLTQIKDVFGKSIRDFNVLPKNDPSTNKENLQMAIDWASKTGSALFVEPSDQPYHVQGGLILKKNVSLLGVHGPTPGERLTLIRRVILWVAFLKSPIGEIPLSRLSQVRKSKEYSFGTQTKLSMTRSKLFPTRLLLKLPKPAMHRECIYLVLLFTVNTWQWILTVQ